MQIRMELQTGLNAQTQGDCTIKLFKRFAVEIKGILLQSFQLSVPSRQTFSLFSVVILFWTTVPKRLIRGRRMLTMMAKEMLVTLMQIMTKQKISQIIVISNQTLPKRTLTKTKLEMHVTTVFIHKILCRRTLIKMEQETFATVTKTMMA